MNLTLTRIDAERRASGLATNSVRSLARRLGRHRKSNLSAKCTNAIVHAEGGTPASFHRAKEWRVRSSKRS